MDSQDIQASLKNLKVSDESPELGFQEVNRKKKPAVLQHHPRSLYRVPVRPNQAGVPAKAAPAPFKVSPIPASTAQVCRYCKSPGHLIADCPKRCFRCNKFGHGHRQCPENSGCNYCHSLDHKIVDCPLKCPSCGLINRHGKDCTAFCRYCKATDHTIESCSKRCHLCGLLGHRANHCPDKEVITKQCFHCGEEGHLKYECPKAKCEDCGSTGHWRNACPHQPPQELVNIMGGSSYIYR